MMLDGECDSDIKYMEISIDNKLLILVTEMN